MEKFFLKRLHETLYYSFRNVSAVFPVYGTLTGFKNNFYDLYRLL